MGPVVELLGKRRAQMFDMQGVGCLLVAFFKYKIPNRGLLGLRNAILTASCGTAILNTIFDSCGPGIRVHWLPLRWNDSEERGQLFIGPSVKVYKGQIVGIRQRPGDLSLNVCKKKAATNIRSNKEQTVILDTPLDDSLDDCIEYIQEDELVEVTPASIRMCKNPKQRNQTGSQFS
ncbi:hypothetical protein DVH24_016013 [Malus domestica]|uniref:TypA/BipA C-terminal domain-containing protein n=1 Tax=Malus domestica TaxID=3750 RepID=A0A498JFN4_MALDO|nr:hypothetical protein DVH24_016013 [Malus domestica]